MTMDSSVGDDEEDGRRGAWGAGGGGVVPRRTPFSIQVSANGSSGRSTPLAGGGGLAEDDVDEHMADWTSGSSGPAPPSVSTKFHDALQLPLQSHHSLMAPSMPSGRMRSGSYDHLMAVTSSISSARSGSASAVSSARSEDESPRISLPPGRAGAEFYLTPRDSARGEGAPPQSTEKRRWLARMSLLGDTGAGAVGFGSQAGGGDSKLAKVSQADDDATRLALGPDKWVYMEYLDWMGAEPLDANIDKGDIACHSCRNVIGQWTWVPTPRQCHAGALDTPVIRIHKAAVHQAEVPLDATPVCTPRPDPASTPRGGGEESEMVVTGGGGGYEAK